ncbi:MAG: c-type cytochrome [Verrucomicrobiales bacterium]|nr:c-type cytochrome [Verrucomicrobiales bacterium]
MGQNGYTGIFGIALAVVLSLLATDRGESHPAHAKPVKYPFVVGFERFYTNLDTPDHLATGGLILLNELNCVACHAPPEHLKSTLTGRPGTRLDGVADRFEHLDLEMMVRNPRFVKTDTIMPSMFSGPDRDLDEIDSLKHFLSTLKEPVKKYPEGDIEAGKLLYHKIGCVSCHAPELDYRPPWVPASVEMNLTSLPSVPMNLADRYPREVLIDFLLDPTKHRPSGRMPKFDLTEKEAIDIGTYLNATPKPELPEQLQNALSKAYPFQPDPERIEKGRELFASKNCVACHSGIVEAESLSSKPLGDLTTDAKGCLSDRPPGGGVPAYGLDQLQKRSIIEALKRIQETKVETPEQEVDWILSSRNCYSCHERNGKGGPEAAREVFFTVNNPDSLPNGKWAAYPPILDKVGAKLTDRWWQKSLYHHGGSGSIRDFMALRMPIYRPEDLGKLESHLKSLDEMKAEAIEGGDAEAGAELVGFDGKNCVACHGIGDLPPPGVVSVALNETVDRLTPNYFYHFLKDPQSIHPEIPMPNLELSDKEISDIWAYLSEIEKHPLPDGLLTPDVTEIKPNKQPEVARVLLENLSQDAIAIGFPGGVNFAFDIEKSALISRWSGRFIDPGAEPVKPLGDLDTDFQEIPLNDRYKGYRIGPDTVTILGEKQIMTISQDGAEVIEIKE